MAAIADRKSMKHIYDSIQFYQHQVEGIRTLAKMRSFILADDMGLGKSLQALVVFCIDVVLGWSQTCLIVCPTSLKGNWADEISKFTYGIEYMVLSGTPKQRNIQLVKFMAIQGPKILIVNYEQVKPHLNELNLIKFDVAIYDEAHYIKSPKSQRTKACHQLRSRRRFLLSGTPLLNHANELWSLLHMIDPNRFDNYWGFVNEYCVFGGYEGKAIVGVKNEKRLKSILQDFMLRRLKSEVLDLPEVQYIERRVDLDPHQVKLYEQVESELQIPIVGEPDPAAIENALTKFLRLKQVCGTTAPFTGEDHSSKLDLAVEDDIELLERDEKIVVFTQFRSVQDAYVARMQKARPSTPIWILNGDVPADQRSEVVKAWGGYPGASVLVCMLQVAGIGLNMTAAKHGSFLDELFTPGLNQQAVDRLHRIGASTTQPIQIRKYITRNTVENRVAEILRIKQKVFKDIIEDSTEWKRTLYNALMEKEAA